MKLVHISLFHESIFNINNVNNDLHHIDYQNIRVSADFNAPNKEQIYEFMDTAILKHGVNLIDTAEQYPIPSDGKRANEGDSERVIGEWMKDRGLVKGEGRKKVVIASKITGGR